MVILRRNMSILSRIMVIVSRNVVFFCKIDSFCRNMVLFLDIHSFFKFALMFLLQFYKRYLCLVMNEIFFL